MVRSTPSGRPRLVLGLVFLGGLALLRLGQLSFLTLTLDLVDSSSNSTLASSALSPQQFALQVEYMDSFPDGQDQTDEVPNENHSQTTEPFEHANENFGRSEFLSSEQLRQRHPACFDERLFSRHEPRQKKVLQLHRTARYVLAASPTEPAYSYQTCSVMKARYNCETTEPRPFGQRAYDWHLVLQPSNSSTATCNLRAFVHDLGGPAGLAQHLSLRRRQRSFKASEQRHPTPVDRPVTILLYGISYLRQAWEALTCEWSHQMTNYTLQHGGPSASVVQSNLTREHVGHWVHQQDWNAGCHGGTVESNRHFLAPGLESPPTLPDCNDNVAMVEFNHQLRFLYVFRPYMYQNVTDTILTPFGTSQEQADALVWMDLGHELGDAFYQQEVGSSLLDQSSYWPWPEDWWAPLQEREIGRWFGADNVGMDHIPDVHACMPGVPDDESHLLLFLLYHDAILHRQGSLEVLEH